MNVRKLIAIEAVFHNIDFVRIPIEYIGTFQLNGLTTNDEAKSEYWAEQFVIAIDRSYKAYTCEFYVDAMDCLRDCHISYIERVYESESRDRVNINWCSQNQNRNVNQRSKTNRHGDLFLKVSANAELDSIFPADAINADDYTVFGDSEEPMNISELGLSVRSYNLLKRKGIHTVDALLSMTDDEIIDLFKGYATSEIREAIKPLRKTETERMNED